MDLTDGERFLLGSILEGNTNFSEVVGAYTPGSFSVPANRLIFERMTDLFHRREQIDRATVANELMKHDELESIGGLSYLVQMTPDKRLEPTEADLLEGMRDAAAAMRDQEVRARIVHAAQRLIDRAIYGTVETATLQEVTAADGLLAIANSLDALAKAIREAGPKGQGN